MGRGASSEQQGGLGGDEEAHFRRDGRQTTAGLEALFIEQDLGATLQGVPEVRRQPIIQAPLRAEEVVPLRWKRAEKPLFAAALAPDVAQNRQQRDGSAGDGDQEEGKFGAVHDEAEER